MGQGGWWQEPASPARPPGGQGRGGIGAGSARCWDGPGGAASAGGAAGVNPADPISCSHQGTRAHPSATEGLFWELAGDEATGALPEELTLRGAGRVVAPDSALSPAARGE